MSNVKTKATYPQGGTGLDSLGTAGQVLKTNTGATGLEWGDIKGATESIVVVDENVNTLSALVGGLVDNIEINQDTATWAANFGMTTTSERIKQGQTFTVGETDLHLNKIGLKIKKTGLPSNNVEVKLFTDNKTTQIGTTQTIVRTEITSSYILYKLNFSNIILTANTTYFIETSTATTDSSNYYSLGAVLTDQYAGGTLWSYGTSWIQASTCDAAFYIYSLAGEIVMGQANDNDKLKFIGFAETSALSGETTNLLASGIIDGFSSLSKGNSYYLSDTVGEISKYIGTNNVEIGIAISATKLRI